VTDTSSPLSVARERVLILDSATGTGVQDLHLTPDQFDGLDGCLEYLNLANPDIIRRLHDANLAVGVDAIKTNSFGANAVVLAEYGIADQALAISRAAGQLARQAADAVALPDRPRFVFGSMGPGTKLPSLGQVDFDTLHAAYRDQATGLLQGGVDAILIETVYDLLQAKAAIIAAHDAMADQDRLVPILVSVTIETTGQMLVGSEIGAALTALAPLDIDAFGINCATGPDLMHEHLRYLQHNSPIPILCQPNAGLPRLENGEAVYDLGPDHMLDAYKTFVRDYGVSIIGGCCGTTPDHMRAVVDELAGDVPAAREPQMDDAVASLYVSVPYEQDTSFLIVGERANANGSRRFKRLLSEDNFDEMANTIRDQANEGAHVADVCVDFVGRDGAADMERLVAAAAGRTTLPLMIDSTEPDVMEAGLKHIGGRPILNSINLEDGGARLDTTLRAARRFGAAVVALVIDEEGQARTADRKLEIAHRIYRIATDDYGIRPQDIFFDALTLPLGSGQDELRNDGAATLEAIRRINAELPAVHTILGVSNISFGLNPAARQVLNSVFLHEALAAGLDAAIVNARQILPEHRIDPAHAEAARRLIHNDWQTEQNGQVGQDGQDGKVGQDPLQAFMALFEDLAPRSDEADLADVPVDERLHLRIIDGLREGLADDLDEALGDHDALTIVNGTLLPAMQVVGDLFGEGKMQLPFVLQSAATMKAAVSHLEPHMEKSDATGKGTIVLATVRGDVHDIGKNLVDIILSNNGYTTVNLGIKQPINAILEAADEHNADAIGLSGLLVKSARVMEEDLQEINRRELANRYPVLLGGAALTRRYVEQQLRDVYDGAVYYGKDAFEGLAIMAALAEGREPDGQNRTSPIPTEKPAATATATRSALRSSVRTDSPIAQPPFWGRRVISGIPIRQITPYLNETALFRGQWGLRKGDLSDADFEALLDSEARPTLRRLEQQAIAESILQPAVVYGYFPVQADGNDLIIYNDDRQTERARLQFPRQDGKQNLCLSDYYRSTKSGAKSGEMDVAGFHIVTVGTAVGDHAHKLFEDDQYQDYLYWHGYGVEMAEALAEYWHQHIRQELAIAANDGPTPRDLIAGRYQGARFSFGYPACPNLEDQQILVDLLQPQEIGVTLSEEFQLHPEQTTSAIITTHPEAAYFTV
jgi:5-methyltetrahydrofolate--homocysteine methyltransferase